MILVTGGAGFVGSNLIAGLEERGHRGIAVCDRLGDGDRWRAAGFDSPFFPVENGVGRYVRDFLSRGDPYL